MKLRFGEKIFDRIEPIEDTKGNSGAKGRMVVTNLRIIWHSMSSPRINLCKVPYYQISLWISLGSLLSIFTIVFIEGKETKRICCEPDGNATSATQFHTEPSWPSTVLLSQSSKISTPSSHADKIALQTGILFI